MIVIRWWCNHNFWQCDIDFHACKGFTSCGKVASKYPEGHLQKQSQVATYYKGNVHKCPNLVGESTGLFSVLINDLHFANASQGNRRL
jgi:MoaA/NifB/PqqE/SkfB family radical SAM enzyme